MKKMVIKLNTSSTNLGAKGAHHTCRVTTLYSEGYLLYQKYPKMGSCPILKGQGF